jgi:hypothetical protein
MSVPWILSGRQTELPFNTNVPTKKADSEWLAQEVLKLSSY